MKGPPRRDSGARTQAGARRGRASRPSRPSLRSLPRCGQGRRPSAARGLQRRGEARFAPPREAARSWSRSSSSTSPAASLRTTRPFSAPRLPRVLISARTEAGAMREAKGLVRRSSVMAWGAEGACDYRCDGCRASRHDLESADGLRRVSVHPPVHVLTSSRSPTKRCSRAPLLQKALPLKWRIRFARRVDRRALKTQASSGSRGPASRVCRGGSRTGCL